MDGPWPPRHHRHHKACDAEEAMPSARKKVSTSQNARAITWGNPLLPLIPEEICLPHWLAALGNLPRVALARQVDELSRNRTYIRNLEGFCPDPLDDEPFRLVLTTLPFQDLVDVTSVVLPK